MTADLTCTQVSALLSFYIDGKLSSQLTQFVEAHLENCPICREKCEALKSMIKSLKEVHAKVDSIKNTESSVLNQNAENEDLNDTLRANLSAYIDNELSDSENLKVKKAVISNSKARSELEKMVSLKKILHNAFEKAKNECKDDYSKLIFRRIDMQEEVYGNDSFGRIVAVFILIFCAFSITAVIMFGA